MYHKLLYLPVSHFGDKGDAAQCPGLAAAANGPCG